MLDEAEEEWRAVRAEAEKSTIFWRVGVVVAMGSKRWEDAVDRARRLVAVSPQEEDGYVHLAFCLHELGRTLEAKAALENGPLSLKSKPIYYYNLACYEAQLGHLERARHLLDAALHLEPSYRKIAEEDPDLRPLR